MESVSSLYLQWRPGAGPPQCGVIWEPLVVHWWKLTRENKKTHVTWAAGVQVEVESRLIFSNLQKIIVVIIIIIIIKQCKSFNSMLSSLLGNSLQTRIWGHPGNFKFNSGFQSYDGGSLVTRVNHHGNWCWTPNLLRIGSKPINSPTIDQSDHWKNGVVISTGSWQRQKSLQICDK